MSEALHVSGKVWRANVPWIWNNKDQLKTLSVLISQLLSWAQGIICLYSHFHVMCSLPYCCFHLMQQARKEENPTCKVQGFHIIFYRMVGLVDTLFCNLNSGVSYEVLHWHCIKRHVCYLIKISFKIFQLN